jgi:hypothetical protein
MLRGAAGAVLDGDVDGSRPVGRRSRFVRPTVPTHGVAILKNGSRYLPGSGESKRRVTPSKGVPDGSVVGTKLADAIRAKSACTDSSSFL